MADLNDLISTEVPKQKGNVKFSGETELTTDVVKCKNCGSNMVFNPEKQKLHCEHCDSEIDFTKNQDIQEQDFLLRECSFDDWSSETVVIRCNNCGSKEIISKTDIAKVCPFCGTSNIIVCDELPGIKPTAVFPFTVSRNTCETSLRNWLKKKWYVPTGCKKQSRDMGDNLNGVYCPCWTFDSETVSNYSGVLGKYYTRTVGSGKDRRTVTEIRYFNVSGVYDKFFDDIMIEASPEIDTKTFNKLRPFDKASAAVYDKKFLSGFTANHYDKDIEQSFGDAKNIMKDSIRKDIIRRHNADVVQYLNVSTYHNNIKFKYLLMPIWVGNYTYNKKIFHYYVNGNSCKIVGKAPKSAGRICAFIFGVLGVLGLTYGIYYLVTNNDNNKDKALNSEVYECVQERETNYEIPGYKFIY